MGSGGGEGEIGIGNEVDLALGKAGIDLGGVVAAAAVSLWVAAR